MARLVSGQYTEPPPGTGGIMPAPPVPAFLKAAQANAPDETWLVQILEKAELPRCGVGERLLRPDWEWSRNGCCGAAAKCVDSSAAGAAAKEFAAAGGLAAAAAAAGGVAAAGAEGAAGAAGGAAGRHAAGRGAEAGVVEAVTTRGAGGDGDGEGGATENDLSVDSAAAGATTNGEGEDEEAAVPPVPGLKSPRSGMAAYAARDVDGGGGEAAAEGSGAAAEDGEPSSATAEGEAAAQTTRSRPRMTPP